MIHLPKRGWFCSFEKCQHLMDSTSVWEQQTEEGAHLPCGCPHKLGFSGDGRLMIGVDFFFFFWKTSNGRQQEWKVTSPGNQCMYMCACSVVSYSATPWTASYQSPLSTEFSQARILERVAISYSKGSSWPGDRRHVSFIGRWILYPWVTREALLGIRKSS